MIKLARRPFVRLSLEIDLSGLWQILELRILVVLTFFDK